MITHIETTPDDIDTCLILISSKQRVLDLIRKNDDSRGLFRDFIYNLECEIISLEKKVENILCVCG